jgi:TnpA family transposase
MAHRIILTKKQRHHLLALPADEPTLLNHYVFNDDDLSHIHKRLNPHNRFGFALQLCAFRYPGRYLQKGEVIPKSLLAFVAAQLGIAEEVITRYAKRPETRYHHTKELRRIYQYTPYSKAPLPDILNWLTRTAIDTRSNAELAELFVVDAYVRMHGLLPSVRSQSALIHVWMRA